MKYVRYQNSNGVSYGILDGDTVRQLSGDLFQHKETGSTHKLSDVKLLTPCEPSKVVCIARNYASHMGDRATPTRPEMFWKPPSSLQNHGDPIILPQGWTNVHYEGELVLVIGKRLKKASKEESWDAIFGGTCGNDLSDRDIQNGPNKDLQWWRAKGADTFGPMGPCIATDLNWSDLLLQTRLNGEVVQEQRTAELLFDIPTMISFTSQWVTLEPGDVIFTGTPNITRKVSPGDTVEVEVEGIGVLRNPVLME
jgi:2-keto-4-pentenoate hydratase/2-oxohepta-3-ene-1,7-dioic acid hydratase in catechol pathway